MKLKKIFKFNLCVMSICFFFLSLGCEEGDVQEEADILKEESIIEPQESISFLTETGGDLKISLYDEGQVLVSLLEPARSLEIISQFQRSEADLIDLYLAVTGETKTPDSVRRMNN